MWFSSVETQLLYFKSARYEETRFTAELNYEDAFPPVAFGESSHLTRVLTLDSTYSESESSVYHKIVWASDYQQKPNNRYGLLHLPHTRTLIAAKNSKLDDCST